MNTAHHFIPGHPAPPRPLAQFLPPIPEGISTTWLHENIPAGSRLLDPFGAAPYFVAEAARAGYRMIVAANNPVARFLIESAVQPFDEAILQAALADLSAARKGDQRLQTFLLSLYQTICRQCQTVVPAQSFIWDRETGAPVIVRYRCPRCNTQEEFPTTEDDIATANRYAASGLHRARALERVVTLNDPDREHAEEALSAYPSRAIYALAALINKLEGIALQPRRRQALEALCLTAFDRVTALWGADSQRERPRQLSMPTRYIEYNLWLALEEAIKIWSNGHPPVSLTIWPDEPLEAGGISLFEGRLKDLSPQLRHTPIDAVVTVLPRPNQAFWTLSALWSGWLWGPENVSPYKSVLRRKRYDWAWHTNALHAVWLSINQNLAPDTPIFGLIGEAEPGFITAALTGARLAGLQLDDVAVRNDSATAQLFFHTNAGSLSGSGNFEQAAKDQIQQALCQRGEPARYLNMLTAALQGGYADIDAARQPGDAYNQTVHSLRNVLSYRGGLLRYGTGDQTSESGLWWLRQEHEIGDSLTNRIEKAIVQYLIQNPGISFAALDEEICRQFPGENTPDQSLICACLESYGKEFPSASGHWQLRNQDAPIKRKSELVEMRKLLHVLGERLGMTVKGERPIIFYAPDGKACYSFSVQASARLNSRLKNSTFPFRHCLIVIPGGRANLILFKLQNNPHIEQRLKKEGLRFLKFRHLRQLVENSTLSLNNFDKQLGLDPLTYSAPQIPLL